jgi:site-specific recombinase
MGCRPLPFTGGRRHDSVGDTAGDHGVAQRPSGPFQAEVQQIFREVRSVALFAEAGLRTREGLWSEATRRLVEEILPSAREDTDLAKLIFRLYPTSKSIERLLALPDETFERMAQLVSTTSDLSAWQPQTEDMTQALRLLSVHVVGIGLLPEVRVRSHSGTIEQSPFDRHAGFSGRQFRQRLALPRVVHLYGIWCGGDVRTESRSQFPDCGGSRHEGLWRVET